MQARFSQRYGHSPSKQAIQLQSMDSNLRNSLWNAIDLCYWTPLSKSDWLQDHYNQELCRLCSDLWVDFFRWPLDTMSESWRNTRDRIRYFFFECLWFEVYDFVEFIARTDNNRSRRSNFEAVVSRFLEQEASAYRFTAGSIAPITNTIEIAEVDEAAAKSSDSVTLQLRRALELLSDRQSPDYRNSVKESISAVEGQVALALDKDSGTLGELLKSLCEKSPIHPAFREALSKLYGYTSDEGGIRHSLLDDSREVRFDEAKFMLVVCSAFINYIKASEIK